MEFVLIGKILNTHGIKGDLKVASFSDFNEDRYKKGSKVYVGDEKLEFEILHCRNHQGLWLVCFKGYENINLVEKYKNELIYKSKEDIQPLKKGEYYFCELRGLDVFVKDKQVGMVKCVEEGMTHNNLRVVLSNKKEVLIPYIKEVFVLNVDLEKKRIDIRDVDGLFE